MLEVRGGTGRLRDKYNSAESERAGERGKVRPACLPGWQLTLLDVTFTVCWRFVWKPSHLWLAVWLMSLSDCLCSLRRGHGLIPGITDLFAFGANFQISRTLKYESEHSYTCRQTHVRPPWYAYSIAVGAVRMCAHKGSHGKTHAHKPRPSPHHLLTANENLNVTVLSRASEYKTRHV